MPILHSYICRGIWGGCAGINCNGGVNCTARVAWHHMGGGGPRCITLGSSPSGELGLTVVTDGASGESGLVDGGLLAGGGEGSSRGGVVPQAKLPLDKPFILSEGLPPVPHKSVARILRGEYVDVAELLQDNFEAQRRVATTTSLSVSSWGSKNRREVPDIISWVQCFGAVLTSKFPQHTKELLAYQTLIVREARRCGGKDWLAYDTHFRQQVVGNLSADWSKLNQSLYAVTRHTRGA